MMAFDFTHWNGDLVGLTASFALAAAQKVWREYRQRRGETWPISYGHIHHVTVDDKGQKTKITIAYSYRVGSESFAGTLQKTFDDRDEANAWADALDKKQVAVRYDPEKPSRSQLPEADLEPIVRAAAPFRPSATDEDELRGWRRALVTGGLLAAIIGLAVTVAMWVGNILGRNLVEPSIASKVGISAVVLFAAAFWAGFRSWRHHQGQASPSWMNYIGYALFYYVVFSAAFMPHRAPNPTPGPRGRETYANVRFQLLVYFGALEWCYVRLQSRKDDLQRAGLAIPEAH